jgi:hypothetical protein
LCLAAFGFLKDFGFELTPPPDRPFVNRSQVRLVRGNIAVVFHTSSDVCGPPSVSLELHNGDGRGIHVHQYCPEPTVSRAATPLSGEEILERYAEALRRDFMDVLLGNENDFRDRFAHQSALCTVRVRRLASSKG